MTPRRPLALVLAAVLTALGSAGCPPREPVDPLAGLDSPDPEQRAEAEENLHDIARDIEGGGDLDRDDIERTGRGLMRAVPPAPERPIEARRNAVASLARLGWDMPADAVPLLVDALEDPDPFVRGHAVAGVYRWSKRHRIEREVVTRWRPAAEATVAEIPGWLADPDPVLRRRAAQIARDLEGSARKAEDALVERLFEDPDAEVRIHAAWALVEMHAKVESVSTERLLERLGDPEKDVRSGVALLVAGRGKEAVPALIEALGADGWQQRKDAAFALGEIGPEARSALPALRARYEDAILFEAMTIERAIEKIEGTAEPDG